MKRINVFLPAERVYKGSFGAPIQMIQIEKATRLEQCGGQVLPSIRFYRYAHKLLAYGCGKRNF